MPADGRQVRNKRGEHRRTFACKRNRNVAPREPAAAEEFVHQNAHQDVRSAAETAENAEMKSNSAGSASSAVKGELSAGADQRVQTEVVLPELPAVVAGSNLDDTRTAGSVDAGAHGVFDRGAI